MSGALDLRPPLTKHAIAIPLQAYPFHVIPEVTMPCQDATCSCSKLLLPLFEFFLTGTHPYTQKGSGPTNGAILNSLQSNYKGWKQ